MALEIGFWDICPWFDGAFANASQGNLRLAVGLDLDFDRRGEDSTWAVPRAPT